MNFKTSGTTRDVKWYSNKHADYQNKFDFFLEWSTVYVYRRIFWLKFSIDPAIQRGFISYYPNLEENCKVKIFVIDRHSGVRVLYPKLLMLMIFFLFCFCFCFCFCFVLFFVLFCLFCFCLFLSFDRYLNFAYYNSSFKICKNKNKTKQNKTKKKKKAQSKEDFLKETIMQHVNRQSTRFCVNIDFGRGMFLCVFVCLLVACLFS